MDLGTNPFTCNLKRDYDDNCIVKGGRISSDQKSDSSFAVFYLQKFLDSPTRYLMAVPHNGPRLPESERTYLERDLSNAVTSLATPEPYDLLTVIKLLDAIELVLTTLVMDNPTHYSMSQLWGIASKYLGPKLYKRNISIRHQPHWIAMRRMATEEIVGGTSPMWKLMEAAPPESFETIGEYLSTLAWATTSDPSPTVSLYNVIGKIGVVLGNGDLFEKVDAALSSLDPVVQLEKVRLEVDVAWFRIHTQSSQPKMKKRRKQ